MPRGFDPPADIPVLRECLILLGEKENLSPVRLIKLLKKFKPILAVDGIITRTPLTNFISAPRGSTHFGRIDQLRDIWNCLAVHPYYNTFLPRSETENTDGGRAKDPVAALSDAVTGFFGEQRNVVHVNNMETIKRRLPGRYVMYRPDWRSLANHLPPNRAVTVSIVEIFVAEQALCIRETQDFPTSPYGQIFQINEGVLFCYGSYLIGVLNGREVMSFKCLAIQELLPFSTVGKVLSFCGQMLVASGAALFPSAKIFCQRVENTYNKVGIIPFEEIDNATALTYITTPTFNPHTTVS